MGDPESIRTDDQPVRLRAALAALPAYVPGARQRPGGFKLSSNENPFPPLPSVQAAIAESVGRVNRYPDMFAVDLVDALARKHDLDPAQIVVGTGSVGVLGHLLQAVAGDGDDVVYPWRSFEAYPIVIGVTGATGVPVPLTADGRLDTVAMAQAVTPATRAVLICSPNNPTGTVVGQREFDDLLDAVPADVVVIVDEAYIEFVRDDAAAKGPRSLAAHPNVVVLRTFSKAYGLAGLRVGYALAHPRLAAAIRTTSIPFGVSDVAQWAARVSLDAEGELFDRVDLIVGWRDRLVDGLRSQGWSVPDTQANFVWLPTLDRTPEFAAAARDDGLIVRPFGTEGVRITVGEPCTQEPILELARRFRAPSA